MKTVKLYDIIVKIAESGLTILDKEGLMPAGHNGLKNDPETPVRAMGHWSMIFLKAYSITKKEKFLQAGRKCLDYLRKKDARPYGKTFWHRYNPKKDKCNGIMGQAFSIEALCYGAEILGDPQYQKIAKEVFLMLPFDKKRGLWKKVEIDGKIQFFDFTLNHQLWFASASSEIPDKKVKEKVSLFLTKLTHNMDVHQNGLLIHEIIPRASLLDKFLAIAIKCYTSSKHKQKEKITKEIIYHSYNLYALANLKKNFPSHPFWQNNKFLQSLSLCREKSFMTKVIADKEKYWSAPLGIEYAYIWQTFFKDDKENNIRNWVREDLNYHFNSKTNLFNKNVIDKNTFAARFYEAVQLNDCVIGLNYGAKK